MRLLKLDKHGGLSLTKDLQDNSPPYAILSHTWGDDEDEITLNDITSLSFKNKPGYAKIKFCGEQAEKDKIEHFWVDTCCIDKKNLVELSEAITSMFRWYRDAVKCYVYLPDVSARKNTHQADRVWELSFRKSRWFTRGWTLQELIAPKSVEFYSREGECLGDKLALAQMIHEITGIPITALHGAALSSFSVSDRISWTKTRTTKRKEDEAYCLLGIFNVFIPPIYGEKENAIVRLNEEIAKRSRIVERIPYAKGAAYSSYEDGQIFCHPATRVDLLHQIQGWAQQEYSKSIFWLSGMAGIGKSTISRTFANWLSSRAPLGTVDIGASFFFKRGEGDRGLASRFFPTIVRELVSKISGLDELIADVIKSDPLIFDKALGEQFDKLLYQPLQKISCESISYLTFVVVVDALDECERENDIRTILKLWSELSQVTSIRLKLFLTSRPELPIRLEFKDMPIHIHEDIILYDAVPQTTIQHDISIYLHDEFSRIRKEHNADLQPSMTLELNWPGEQIIQDLTEIAIPLFIVAATVVRFVGDSNWDPQERLGKILQFQGIGTLEQMEQIYLPVLTQLHTTLSTVQDKEKLYEEFRLIIGSIVTLAEPLSVSSLAILLSLDTAHVLRRLRSMYSVIHVPSDLVTPIRTLHLSFREFLLGDKIRHQPYGVDGPATHRLLFEKCLHLLSGPRGLRENLCDLTFPGQPRSEVNSVTIHQCLSPALQYASQYWVYHIQQGTIQVDDDSLIYTFLQKHFLHWLEAMSLIEKLAQVMTQIATLQSLISPQNSTEISLLLGDMRRFVLTNRFIADYAPLQIYSSAILFTPRESVVRKICGKIPKWIKTSPITATAWGAELQRFEGDTRVYAVTFSPDGSLLASASYDHTIRLWDHSTGRALQTLEGHTEGVSAVTFSPDGSLLVSASYDRTIRLWDRSTGRALQTLEGHTEGVSAVTFSPDGSLLASASHDCTIRLWDRSTGRALQTLEGHGGGVNAVTFSPDGSLLASGSDDGTVRLWDRSTGRALQTLEGHMDSVSTVTFSPDGSLLASGSGSLWALYDHTIRLWDRSTGHALQPLEGHTGGVNAVTFSPDGSLLASGSEDGTVRLWDRHINRALDTLEGHTSNIKAVTFSPDGSLLASVSLDGTIMLWNRSTGRALQTLEGYMYTVTAVVFSPDCSLLALASSNSTVKLWDCSTGRTLQTLKDHSDGVNAVAFSPDGSLLASGSKSLWSLRDCTVKLWDRSTGHALQTFEGHTGGVNAVAFSPDGSLLASASEDGSVRLWDCSTGHALQTLCHTDGVTAVAFSPDGSLLASASESFWPRNYAIRLWDRSTGRAVQTLESLPGIRCLYFADDPRFLLTNLGALPISVKANLTADQRNFSSGAVFIKDAWIQQDGRNLLWLPQEYRSAFFAFYMNTIAFGQHSGRVTFLQIGFSEIYEDMLVD